MKNLFSCGSKECGCSNKKRGEQRLVEPSTAHQLSPSLRRVGHHAPVQLLSHRVVLPMELLELPPDRPYFRQLTALTRRALLAVGELLLVHLVYLIGSPPVVPDDDHSAEDEDEGDNADQYPHGIHGLEHEVDQVVEGLFEVLRRPKGHRNLQMLRTRCA